MGLREERGLEPGSDNEAALISNRDLASPHASFFCIYRYILGQGQKGLNRLRLSSLENAATLSMQFDIIGVIAPTGRYLGSRPGERNAAMAISPASEKSSGRRPGVARPDLLDRSCFRQARDQRYLRHVHRLAHRIADSVPEDVELSTHSEVYFVSVTSGHYVSGLGPIVGQPPHRTKF